MSSIYNFYGTTDGRVVEASSNPNVYDELLLEGGRVVWLRTERCNSPRTRDEVALANEPLPGEFYLGTVEL